MLQDIKLDSEYWESFSLSNSDVDEIFSLLLEKEIPLSAEELVKFITSIHIQKQISFLEEQKKKQGNIFLPKNEFNVDDELIFPILNGDSGKVIKIRDGVNPDFEDLKVLEVEMKSGKNRFFASNIANHTLNNIVEESDQDPNLDQEYVIQKYGELIQNTLEDALKTNDDLVKIAGNWFPRSLLVDINLGHLNLAEAVLEESDGGPLGTVDLMKQVELVADADERLVDFSFDLALQEDKRFDEVGPAGETLWYLHDKEPEKVKETPIYLSYHPEEYPTKDVSKFLELFEGNVYDELENWDSLTSSFSKISISLIFPHWRSGTLPLSSTIKNMFPTAYEAPRVKFEFVDKANGERFPGWVVRPNKYIYGLEEWYEVNGLMPGSLVSVEKSENPGEIYISFDKSRQNKEWLRTILVGSDQGIVFAMLKHSIKASFNERMAVAIPDIQAIDEIWEMGIYKNENFPKTLMKIIRELSKLSPQGQVHAQELYSAMNLIYRCPPSQILSSLLNNDKISHLGDLYFRIKEGD